MTRHGGRNRRLALLLVLASLVLGCSSSKQQPKVAPRSEAPSMSVAASPSADATTTPSSGAAAGFPRDWQAHLPGAAPSGSYAPTKCGQLPFPGPLMYIYRVSNCWALFWSHTRCDCYFSFLAGRDPQPPHTGVILLNKINQRVFALPTPSNLLRPVIKGVILPYLCVGYRGSDRIDRLNITNGRWATAAGACMNP